MRTPTKNCVRALEKASHLPNFLNIFITKTSFISFKNLFIHHKLPENLVF